MKKQNVLLLLLLVCLQGISACRALRQEAEADRIYLNGNIELLDVSLAFKVPGKVVGVLVDEGDFISEGVLLAKLENNELSKQREEALANLKSARSRLREMEAQITFQRENVRAQIDQKKAQFSQAEAGLEKALTGSRRQEIEGAEATVRRAEAEFDRARGDWERAQVLFGNEDISRAQFEAYRAAFEASQANLEESRERSAITREGPRKEDIEIARAVVAQARAGLELAESLKLDIKRNEQAVDTIRAEIEAVEAQIAVLEIQLEDTELKSPLAGVILVKAAEEGEVVPSGSPILVVGDLEHPWVRGYLSETDLGRVKLGDHVKVTTDSYPGKIYWARVSFISSEAEFTPKQIQSAQERVKLVYRIKVDISNEDQELKLNMPVDAEILLGSAGRESRRSPPKEEGTSPASW